MRQLYDGIFIGTDREMILFLYAMLAGALLGSVYDILRALRISLKHHPAFVACEDFFFVTVCGAVYFTFCTALLEGKLRLFVLLGMMVGLALYLMSLGRLICGVVSCAMSTAVKGAKILVKISKKICANLCVVPFFKKVGKKISKPVARSGSNGI